MKPVLCVIVNSLSRQVRLRAHVARRYYLPNLGIVGIRLSVGWERVVESSAAGEAAALVAPALPGEQPAARQEALVVGAGLVVAVAVITAVLLAA